MIHIFDTMIKVYHRMSERETQLNQCKYDLQNAAADEEKKHIDEKRTTYTDIARLWVLHLL